MAGSLHCSMYGVYVGGALDAIWTVFFGARELEYPEQRDQKITYEQRFEFDYDGYSSSK